ncbi:hypothetical protein D3C76_1461680 [compost metagenome]
MNSWLFSKKRYVAGSRRDNALRFIMGNVVHDPLYDVGAGIVVTVEDFLLERVDELRRSEVQRVA